eukprot:1750234-Amphidinium_carterae.1
MDWHWIVNTSSLTEQERWAALGAAAAKALTAKHPWRSVFGPAGATIMTLARLGLHMESPSVIHGFARFDLRVEGEYRVRDLAAEATDNWSWQMHRCRDADSSAQMPCYAPVVRALRQLAGRPLAQYGLASSLSDGVWTPEVFLLCGHGGCQNMTRQPGAPFIRMGRRLRQRSRKREVVLGHGPSMPPL